MNDMRAFQQRTNEARSAIGKPPVIHRPTVTYAVMNASRIGQLIMWVQDYELSRSVALAEIERIANEARQ